MREHTRQLDAAGQLSYLETDKRENVTFYERHGYALVGEAEIIGVPNWFMLRDPGSAGVLRRPGSARVLREPGGARE
jgi:hypothetical protein